MQESIESLKEKAEAGDAEAQFKLSQMYERGEGVPQNYAEALKWSQEARKTTTEQGDAETQFKMGVRYLQGQGRPKDYDEAAKWFQKAAEQGHAKAQDKLGCMPMAKACGRIMTKRQDGFGRPSKGMTSRRKSRNS